MRVHWTQLRLLLLQLLVLSFGNLFHFFRVEISQEDINSLRECCKNYLNGYFLFLRNITPTVWTIGHCTPYHTQLLYDKFRLGLGLNTMQGREHKHIKISNYANYSISANRWGLVFRHEFVSSIWLWEHDPLSDHYKYMETNYVPARYGAPCLTNITLDNLRYFGQLQVLSTSGGTLDNCSCSRQVEVLWTTAGALDKWRYFGQLLMLSTSGGTLDNCRCSRQVEVLWTTARALDKWRYFGQLQVLSTSGGTLDNCSCSRQVEVLWTIRSALHNWRYFGHLGVLSTTGGTLDNCRCSR